MRSKILLIGFRATGKTTIGRRVAELLGWEFRDADEEIEKSIGKSIKEIVEEKGWPFFRELEREYLKDLQRLKRVVCALGGGAVLHQEEIKVLGEDSFIVALKADLGVIKDRLKKDYKTLTQRPSLTPFDWETEVEKLYVERLPYYENMAHIVLDTSNTSVENLAVRIVEKFNMEKF